MPPMHNQLPTGDFKEPVKGEQPRHRLVKVVVESELMKEEQAFDGDGNSSAEVRVSHCNLADPPSPE